MRQIAIVVASIALATSTAFAQPKGQQGKAAAPQSVYFDLSSSIFSELGAEAILKETRQGATVVAAELDVCHLSEPNSSRLDRFVVPLKVEGTRLVGTAQSQEQKQTVSVNLVRRALANGNFTFEGTVRSGSHTDKVRSTDNPETSESDIMEQYLADTAIEEAADSFSAAWPQSLLVRVRREELIGFLDALRDHNVRVTFNGLATTCAVLRSGRYTVQLDVDPERVGAVLAKLKSVSAVAAIGFGTEGPNMQRGVRFPSAGWRDPSGKLDRDKFAATVGAAIADAMSAKMTSTSWNDALGSLAIEMRRPDETVPGLKLSQVVTVTVVIAPESLSSNQQSILWIETITSRIVEERDGHRLEFFVVQSNAQSSDNDEGQPSEPDGSDDLPEAVATALKGQTWDSDKEQWRQ